MPKFDIYVPAVGTRYIGVYEAETAEAAIDLALAECKDGIHLCHACAKEFVDTPELDWDNPIAEPCT